INPNSRNIKEVDRELLRLNASLLLLYALLFEDHNRIVEKYSNQGNQVLFFVKNIRIKRKI
ncbi:MAG TPA: hypothetical protein P5071_00305, partial [Paludibacteraceae bacterium]|nr:hypothetical protein [Paludibacteraceae bacterium]